MQLNNKKIKWFEEEIIRTNDLEKLLKIETDFNIYKQANLTNIKIINITNILKKR